MTTTQSTIQIDFPDTADLTAEIARVRTLQQRDQDRLASLILDNADASRRQDCCSLIQLAQDRLDALHTELAIRARVDQPTAVRVTDLMH
jgi:hypothetical protein